MTPRTALLAGATGLVGRHCLALLLEDDAYASVITLGRRPLEQTHTKLTHHVINFDAMAEALNHVHADDVYCCLGTTMKQAGSQDAFRKVDHDYPLALAQTMHKQGATQFLQVSSMGADPHSRFFYNRIKGLVEKGLQAIGFSNTLIFRPALLTGKRANPRMGEQVAEAVLKGLSFMLVGPLNPYRPVAASTVARAMVAAARDGKGGTRIITSDIIQKIGAAPPAL